MEADQRVTNTERQLQMAKERLGAADRERKLTEATLRAISDLPAVSCPATACLRCLWCGRAALGSLQQRCCIGLSVQETRMYDAIGKMFLLKPKSAMTGQLGERIESGTQTVSVRASFSSGVFCCCQRAALPAAAVCLRHCYLDAP